MENFNYNASANTSGLWNPEDMGRYTLESYSELMSHRYTNTSMDTNTNTDINTNTESNVEENDPTILAYKKAVNLSETAITGIRDFNDLTLKNQNNNNPLSERLIPMKTREFNSMIVKLKKCMDIDIYNIEAIKEVAPYSQGNTALDMYDPYAGRIHVLTVCSSITQIMHIRSEWAQASLECLEDYNEISPTETLHALRHKSVEGNEYYKFLSYVTEKWGIQYQNSIHNIKNRRLTREVFMNLNAIKENYESSTKLYRDSVESVSNTYKKEYADINLDIESHKKGGHLPIFKAEKFFSVIER